MIKPKESVSTLAANVAQLMKVHGLKKAGVSDRAIKNGFQLHRSTLTRVLQDGEDVDNGKTVSYFKSDTLEAIASAFDVKVSHLLWEHGFDDNGHLIGESIKYTPSDILETFKIVMLQSAQVKIDDLEWQARAAAAVLEEYVVKDKDAAQTAWLNELIAYTSNSK